MRGTFLLKPKIAFSHDKQQNRHGADDEGILPAVARGTDRNGQADDALHDPRGRERLMDRRGPAVKQQPTARLWPSDSIGRELPSLPPLRIYSPLLRVLTTTELSLRLSLPQRLMVDLALRKASNSPLPSVHLPSTHLSLTLSPSSLCVQSSARPSSATRQPRSLATLATCLLLYLNPCICRTKSRAKVGSLVRRSTCRQP